MEYQKIVNLLKDKSNKLSKFTTRNWVEINGEARGTYSPNKQIKFKTAMLRSSLCDYSNAYVLAQLMILLLLVLLQIILIKSNI